MQRISSHFDGMILAIAVWICTVPVVGLLVIPFFGWKVGLSIVVVLSIIVAIICWGICSWKIYKS